MARSVGERIATARGSEVVSSRPLSGGCVGQVALVVLASGEQLVAKSGGTALDTEGWMLRVLAERSRLPVPEVYVSDPDLLVMGYIPGETGCRPEAETHAAELLADLHGVTAGSFGFERDTLIGGLRQPNEPANEAGSSWIGFFRERRLLYMAGECVRAGRAPGALLDRVRALAERLPELIDEPEAPALLHGDLWGGNILSAGGRVTGFIDPAVCYGHPEIELAFTTLFSTFSPEFYEAYASRRPIRDGFFETRRDLYNLYPLLVHTRLFGGAYLAQAEQTLSRFGV